MLAQLRVVDNRFSGVHNQRFARRRDVDSEKRRGCRCSESSQTPTVLEGCIEASVHRLLQYRFGLWRDVDSRRRKGRRVFGKVEIATLSRDRDKS